MEKKKSQILTVVSLIILCLGIIGCGRNQEFAEYKEWYNTLHINRHKGISVHALSEDEGHFQISVKCNPEHLDSFNEVIQAHNDFASAHPGYFDNVSVEYDTVYSSGAGYFRFFNKPHEDFSGLNADWMQCDGAIMYLQGNIQDFTIAYNEHQTEFSESVLILESEDPGYYSEVDYEFLKQFANLERIIIKYSGEYDMDDVVQIINKYTSEVSVYEVLEDYELKQWR